MDDYDRHALSASQLICSAVEAGVTEDARRWIDVSNRQDLRRHNTEIRGREALVRLRFEAHEFGNRSGLQLVYGGGVICLQTAGSTLEWAGFLLPSVNTLGVVAEDGLPSDGTLTQETVALDDELWDRYWTRNPFLCTPMGDGWLVMRHACYHYIPA